MTRSYLPLLLLLSAIWGSSYMFIKAGVRDFSPAALVELRLLLAGAVLVVFVASRRGLAAVRRALAPGAFVGVGMALPSSASSARACSGTARMLASVFGTLSSPCVNERRT